jgi:DNA transposition AAA+ family ATPase
MTLLDELVRERVRVATGITLSRATEQAAEQMAREILKSPEFRAEMQAIIRRAFGDTMATLQRPNGRKRRRRTKKRA